MAKKLALGLLGIDQISEYTFKQSRGSFSFWFGFGDSTLEDDDSCGYPLGPKYWLRTPIKITMTGTLDDTDWKILTDRIKKGRCTPFLGAGAAYKHLPIGKDVAEEWAREHEYPLDNVSDLPRVAQYVATYFDAMWPKEQFLERVRQANPPDFNEAHEPHAVLASLPIKTYLTTNYDNFLCQALEHTTEKKPRREYCRWNKDLLAGPTIFDNEPDYQPDVYNPLVYHLHGHDEVAESIVLTEDDYLDFLLYMPTSKERAFQEVTAAMGSTSMLFLGYSLIDLNFRVLFRSVVRYLALSRARTHVSVQLPPLGAGASDEQKDRAMCYLDQYFSSLNIKVFWGTCREFMRELSDRI